MTSGYYDPHPLFSIERPLALVGHPGSGVAAVARAISARTGLPFNDVARSAESIAGCSRSRVMVEQGGAALLAIEGQALRTAIARTPCGVIAFDGRMLEDARLRALVREGCSLVYVRRPDEVLFDRIERQLADQPGSLPEFVVARPRSAQELHGHLASLEGLLEDAEVLFDAGAEHSGRVAEKLFASLDRILDVERLGG